ncbi:hypothetical protein ABZ816_38230 [Actinosynnema sp. NPDC047251]|uniref:Putative secreted protein n=1 Tax=Saccharothrix espanaensis (strain ATCC 51144 / DSM 44229 / JCM 9112 / NBRC 15066 / NRRL 15764) TaxID=1179773 RepID=K0JVY7_SACES|nr:hypothetical protein [Saccharothrix espanaensis]CCH30161.1 putative secreted protein [Saccharothrix espanaensis DSM 44229]
MGGRVVEKPSGRGFVLTAWLVVYSVGVPALGATLIAAAVRELGHGRTLGIPMVLVLLGLLGEAIALTGLWLWQRWGLSLLAISAAVGLLGAAMGDAPGLIIAGRIVWVCAFVFVLMPRWELFRA